VEYIELEMMKVVLIRVIKEKKVINIVFKSEMAQIFWDTFFLQMVQLLWDGGSNNSIRKTKSGSGVILEKNRARDKSHRVEKVKL